MNENNSVRELKNNIKKQNLKVILPLSISLFLALIITFVTITYAWIFSTYFSDIRGINITLSDTQGLIMILNGEISQTIDINNYLGESFDTFSLKEASTSNGRDLFLRNMSTYYQDDEGIYDSVNVARDDIGIIRFRPAVVSDRNNSFIYFNFTLQAAGTSRYLIFNSADSFIKDSLNQPMIPIRVSLTFDDGNNVATRIIGNRQEYLGNYHTQAVGSIDGSTEVGYTTNQNVSSFVGYNGYTAGVFDVNKTLFYLEENVNVNVTVRIWLEGGDPLCRDEIAGSSLDVSIKFDNIDESEVA